MKNFVLSVLSLICLVGCQSTSAPTASPTAASSSVASSPTPAASPQAEQPSEKALAWTLGEKLSLAALGNGRGADAKAVSGILSDAQLMAEALKLDPIPSLPAQTGDSAADTAAALDYLLSKAGPALATSVGAAHGDQCKALFEMGMKSNMAYLLYVGDKEDSLVVALTGSLEELGTKGQVPNDLWKPVLESMKAGAPQEEVQTAIRDMQKKIRTHFMSAG